ncbi:phosphotransferase [Brevibacillus ginsengisoli]|uniref:phosphotransferase n=1 Tax=Brevibacillus ginsengisoli TaxID=363854 RepID=UPI003CE9D6E1
MNQQRADFRQICGRYKARVFQIKPVHDYYLVETNRGTKELREWPRVDVMRWSFAWREQLARQGFRDVERFLRTRDAKAYVVAGRKGYTLTDHLHKQQEFSPVEGQLVECGTIVARMHQAQLSQRFPVAIELFQKEMALFSLEENRAYEHLQVLHNQYEELTDGEKWVFCQFNPLLERMRKSLELLEGAVSDESLLAVSHRSLKPDNFCLIDGGRLFLKGFYRPVLSIQHRDTADFIKQIFLTTGSLDAVEEVLNGYEKQKEIKYQDYVLLLSFILFPGDSWKKIEQFFSLPTEMRTDEAVLQIKNSLQEQQALDRLLQHIAVRAECLGRGQVYEPI